MIIPVKYVSLYNISSYCVETEDSNYNDPVKLQSENKVEKMYAI